MCHSSDQSRTIVVSVANLKKKCAPITVRELRQLTYGILKVEQLLCMVRVTELNIVRCMGAP